MGGDDGVEIIIAYMHTNRTYFISVLRQSTKGQNQGERPCSEIVHFERRPPGDKGMRQNHA